MPEAIVASDLLLRYGATVAVDHATFSVPNGATVAVIGPNGSGKSTLLRAVAGLLDPSSGNLEVPAADRPGGVALVLQTTDVDRSLPITVRDTVRMARYPLLGPFRRFGPVDHAAVDDAMGRLDITDLASRQLHELSGGQRQRVLVAQGLAQQADLLLLDEPITGLDVTSRQHILDVIAHERGLGHTVVLSTHDLAEARLCDLVLLLAKRLVAFGPPDEVLTAGPLSEAFGGRVLQLGDGSLFVDDPHHVHHDGDDHEHHVHHTHQ